MSGKMSQTEHTLYKGFCVTCKGKKYEGSLTTDCPSYELSELVQRGISEGSFDFLGERWVERGTQQAGRNESRLYFLRNKVVPKSTEWATPHWLFDELHRRYGFTVDAHASDELHMLPRYWTEEDDGLRQDWRGHSVFVNPPFDTQSLAAWTAKALVSAQWGADCDVAMIVPVKSDQAWWHTNAMRASAIHFVRGKVCASDPGPIAVLVFGMAPAERPLLLSLTKTLNWRERDEK